MQIWRSVTQFLRMGVCAAAAWFCLSFVLRFLPYDDASTAVALMRVIVGALVGMGVYVAAALLLRVGQARRVIGMVKSKLLRRAAPPAETKIEEAAADRIAETEGQGETSLEASERVADESEESVERQNQLTVELEEPPAYANWNVLRSYRRSR